MILYPFVKMGFSKKHLKILSELLGHQYFRSNSLIEKLNDIEIIVKEIKERDM